LRVCEAVTDCLSKAAANFSSREHALAKAHS
jgi:hypothetical protein